ncbi:hypothetical protein LEP1GSC073_0575 [Leptospira noguchii str. Cascata]|nr:hypothetical protein LEP1GSC073_0575 [Leptospira noguchii str. Cascata]
MSKVIVTFLKLLFELVFLQIPHSHFALFSSYSYITFRM